jgi:hypothetical protein
VAEIAAPPAVPGFRIVRVLGEGGMGIVYEVERVATHDRFALKVMHGHLAKDETQLARFRREIAALAAIRHPNVVNVFEWSAGGEGSAGKPYIVMELLEGESLAAALKRTHVMAPLRAVQIMLQVTEGLAAAHEKNVLHRDLGPSNIFLEDHGKGSVRAKLLDFGLARLSLGGDASDVVTQEGTVMGKPAYVSPEALRGDPLDARSDVFSCGMVLFRLLAGRMPFQARDARMLWVERWAERNTTEEYSGVRQFASNVPEPLAEVVAKATRRKPEDRYASARDMQAALLALEQSLLDESPTAPDGFADAAPDTSSSVIGGRVTPVAWSARVVRHRLAIAAAAVALLAVAAVVVIQLARSGDDAAVGAVENARAGAADAGATVMESETGANPPVLAGEAVPGPDAGPPQVAVGGTDAVEAPATPAVEPEAGDADRDGAEIPDVRRPRTPGGGRRGDAAQTAGGRDGGAPSRVQGRQDIVFVTHWGDGS